MISLFILIVYVEKVKRINRQLYLTNLELQQKSNEINYLKLLAEKEARTDSLTKVLNKRGFQEVLIKHIEEYKRTQKVFSLVLLDLDYFKKVNDQMGHEIGDKVLCDFADIMVKNLRPYDYFGRIGGEEFAIILPATNIKQSIKIAERLRYILSKYQFKINDHCFQITASFGLSEITENDTLDSLFRRTDQLLYQSKEKGRNRVSYSYFTYT